MTDDDLKSWQRESRRHAIVTVALHIAMFLVGWGIVAAIVLHFLK